jgi:hypothetical protein
LSRHAMEYSAKAYQYAREAHQESGSATPAKPGNKK